jgi:hypothetical protein
MSRSSCQARLWNADVLAAQPPQAHLEGQSWPQEVFYLKPF